MPRRLGLPILDISDVTASQLCCGCGACAALEPNRFRMVDDARFGRRPIEYNQSVTAIPGLAMNACPGAALTHDTQRLQAEHLLRSLLRDWGPVLEVWEGYAADPEIRSAGSSGGAATALALTCLTEKGMHGVLHTASRTDMPIFNESVLSTSREQLLARTGSRYAPASPCDALSLIECAPAPCVFLGKPCDVAGAQRAASLRPALQINLGMTIAFFCAGTPSTDGTLALLQYVGISDPSSVTSLRYRGNGWPGRWVVHYVNDEGAEVEASLSYEESWGFLEKYRQWRCAICPDHTGEFADVAVGDPWYRDVKPGEPGQSLIVARTRRGQELIQHAAATGHLVLERSDPTLLPRSQPNLRRTRGRLWGQLRVLRLMGAGVPRYHGFPTFFTWVWGLSLREKIRSTLGTARRIQRRGLRHRVHVEDSAADKSAVAQVQGTP